MMDKKNWTYYVERALAFVAAYILLETLFYKFSAHPNSVALFTELGIEPWGRIGSGVVELIAGGLLLFRKVSFHGALLAMGTMAGAILSHVAVLGISYNGDGGGLFYRAVFVLIACAVIIVLRKEDIQAFIKEAKQAR
jgi:putative oxidoreductase